LEIGHKIRFFDNLDASKNWLVQEEEAKEPERFFNVGDVEASE
jgi:hypothetical protein